MADHFIDMGKHVHQNRAGVVSTVKPDDSKEWEKASREVMSFYDGAKARLGESDGIIKFETELNAWLNLVRSEEPHSEAWDSTNSDQVTKTWMAARQVHAELSVKHLEEQDNDVFVVSSANYDETGSGLVVPPPKNEKKKKKKAKSTASQGSASTFSNRRSFTVIPDKWDGDDEQPRGNIQR